jgi:hypothetical protein
MALIQCSECNRQISDQALACPGRGAQTAPRRAVARAGRRWEAAGTILVIGGMLTAIIADFPISLTGGVVAFLGLVVFIIGRFK